MQLWLDLTQEWGEHLILVYFIVGSLFPCFSIFTFSPQTNEVNISSLFISSLAACFSIISDLSPQTNEVKLFHVYLIFVSQLFQICFPFKLSHSFAGEEGFWKGEGLKSQTAKVCLTTFSKPTIIMVRHLILNITDVSSAVDGRSPEFYHLAHVHPGAELNVFGRLSFY